MEMDLTNKHCVLCRSDIPQMSEGEEDKYLTKVSYWTFVWDKILQTEKSFKLTYFRETMKFVESS